MADEDAQGQNGAEEEEGKDHGEELIELLNELRVALPGVQVLFAFLLAVPFTQRFTRVTDLQKDVYFVSLLATMLGTVLLIAPSTYHRIRWREGSDEELLHVSNRLVIVGSFFLALAMTSSVFLITDVLFGARTTAVVVAATAACFTWFWFGLPLWRRARS